MRSLPAKIAILVDIRRNTLQYRASRQQYDRSKYVGIQNKPYGVQNELTRIN